MGTNMTARKGISLLLSLALIFSAVLAVLPAPALAAESASEISLDAGVIVKNDTVWFGSYASGFNHSGPVQWRVLSPKGDSTLPVSGTGDVLMISNHLLEDGDVYFKQDGSSNQWAGSDAQAWCTDLYANWPEKEQSAIKATSVTETNDKTSAGRTYYYRGGYFNDYYSAASLNGEHFFFLSAQEADTYFTSDTDRQGYSEYFGRSWYWWLRSPFTDSNGEAGSVASGGWVFDSRVDNFDGARPAFNLNLPSVLFVSAAEGGKSIAAESGESSGAEGAGVYKIPSGSTTEWKLTLKDSSRSGFASSASSVSGAPGGKISIPYSGAKTGTNEYVSILICDSTGAAQYYGSCKISAASGTADFVLPSDLATGNYTVKLFNEQRNGNHESDYASDFISIPLKVGKAVSYQVTFKVANGYWNTGDNDNADKTVTLSGVEGDTLKLASGDIPAAGDKPADTYKPGSWSPATPSASTAITGNTTYTYTYDKKDSISATVVFKVVNGGWNDDSLTGDQTVTLTGLEGDTLKLTDAQIPGVGSNPNDTYKPGSWDTMPSASTTFANGSTTTYTYTYAKKDSISATVVFKVVNGSWNSGNSADITVALSGLEGDTLKLAADQIPTVGSKPNDTFKAGAWDVTPSTETAITAPTTYTYTYAAKEGIGQTVTFKVVNGSWNDGNNADITVTLTGLEGDTLKLTADQIPAVGTKPNDTFKAGAWDVTPSTETAITAPTTYTYTYAAKEGIGQTVTFKVVNGSWNDGNNADITVTLTGLEGDTLKLAADQIPTVGSKPADTYKAGAWDVTPSTETAITAPTTYTYTYVPKDGISQTVTFKVVNGSWDDGTADDKTITLIGHEGDMLKLKTDQIPAVGSKPTANYQAGSWDVTPSTETAITAPTTFTYTYEAVISYTTVSGDGQEYRISSNGDLLFTIKRSVNDDLTFANFRSAALDGQPLGAGDYETAQGSLIFTLKAAKANTLSLGTHTLTFTFSDGTAAATFSVRPVAGSFEDVAVPSASFTFRKVWEGGSEKSIDFTLYKLGGTVYHHGFDKRIISKTEWQYNAWFSEAVACYVIEDPVEGYQTRYENVGVYAGITDRCCDGGTIVNYKVPKTGDEADLTLWLGYVLAGLTIISIAVYTGKRKKAHSR